MINLISNEKINEDINLQFLLDGKLLGTAQVIFDNFNSSGILGILFSHLGPEFAAPLPSVVFAEGAWLLHPRT